MRIHDIKPLKEDASEPFVIRLLRRAIARDGKVAIDFHAVSGRKFGWLIKEPEIGRGWRNGLGDYIPTYRFTVLRRRAMKSGPITFELPTVGVDNLMTLTKKDGKLLIVDAPEKVNEMHVDGEPPIWFNIIQKGISAGKKFYFASGANKIYGVHYRRAAGVPTVNLQLEHVKRWRGGQPDRQTYTIWEKDFDKWTFTKFDDGHRLTMRNALKEEVNAGPPIYTMFWKLKKAGKNVYFKNSAGREIQLNFAKTGLSTSGNDAIWFYSSFNSLGNAVTWKTGDNINKLTLKKKQGTDDWLLFDRTVVKLKESRNEPMIVTLMNKRLNNKGAIKVDVGDMLRKRIQGWITEPIEFMPAQLWGSRDGWKSIIQTITGKKVLWFDIDADEYYTLRTGTDDDGNKFVKLTERDGGQ